MAAQAAESEKNRWLLGSFGNDNKVKQGFIRRYT